MMHHDSDLGALLVASWVNFSLIACMVQSAYRYWTQSSPQDSWMLRVPVGLALVCDVAGVVASGASIYLYVISHFGDESYAKVQNWAFVLYVFSTAGTGLICQSFLLLRLTRLIKQPWYLVTLGLVMSMSFTGALGSGVSILLDSSLSERKSLSTWVSIWLICGALVDILTALALVITLRQVTSVYPTTGGLIKRISAAAVATGSCTALCATIAFIMYKAQPENNICTSFGMILGRLYTLTFLYNLNSRTSKSNNKPQISPPKIYHTTSPSTTFPQQPSNRRTSDRLELVPPHGGILVETEVSRHSDVFRPVDSDHDTKDPFAEEISLPVLNHALIYSSFEDPPDSRIKAESVSSITESSSSSAHGRVDVS